MEIKWLKEALFAGQTSNAFKLGTALTLGWFWPRLSGCSILYRGESFQQIDFANILTVTQMDACLISPPAYLPHESSSTYFYVVRRANNCGDEEHTLSAAVKVSIDADGDLALGQPNNIFCARAKQIAGSRIQLVWYYCPVGQQSMPACFRIYTDNRTGQIDYENPLATIDYSGRMFYSYHSDALETGRYLFAIRARDAAGMEDSSWAKIRVQLDTASPEAMDILGVEAI
jgi:hypothetical protein